MPQRIQMTRQRPWRAAHPDAVIVARPTVWANPFRSGVGFCGPTIDCLYTNAELAAKFREWITRDTLHPDCWDSELIAAHVRIKAALATGALRGKDVACWCRLDQPCHGDVLLEIASGGAS